MIDHLPEIASDLSVFHRIGDAGEMEAAVFFMLAYRLPAYSGAMAAVAAKQAQDSSGSGSGRGAARSSARYERSSPQANNARTADSAPPATAGALAAVDAQLGGGWISHRTVKPGGG